MNDFYTYEERDGADDDYDYLIRLMILGDSSVGKTSFLCRYVHGSFNHKMGSTVGIDFQQKRLLRVQTAHGDGTVLSDPASSRERIVLQLWDTAGQERYRSLCTVMLRDSMGFFLMFDLTNENSFYNCREWMALLTQHAYCERPDVVLIGNKQDLKADRQVTRSVATSMADEFRIPYIEVSAATGYAVSEAVDCLLNRVMQKAEAITIRENVQLDSSSVLSAQDAGRPCGC